MNNVFDIRNYEQRISELTDRAKSGNEYEDDCDLGEQFYLELLSLFVEKYEQQIISRDDLIRKQKALRQRLEKYYQWGEIFDRHTRIQNRCSPLLTEAEKHGCPVCKKLVRIFDGRN
jgi:hypothetical protein